MEFFAEETFKLVKDRFHLRFINYQVLHKIIDTIAVIEPIELVEESKDGATITQTTVSKIDYSPEQIWISIAKALDYDGWDTVNREFVPLSLDEYYQETTNFAINWNIEPERYLLPNQSVSSILKLGEDWEYNEYLIEFGAAIHYIRTVNWTG